MIAGGYYQFYRPRSVSATGLIIDASPEQITRGAYLARTTCAACPGGQGDLPLSGGEDLSKELPLPVGVQVAPNLTPGGELAMWSDEEIAQAIRNGIHKSGRALLMPTSQLRNLSDDDLAAVIAFLRSQPAVRNETPPTTPSVVLALFFGAGLAEVGSVPVSGPVVAPPRERSAAYEGNLVSFQDCRLCHGGDLEGSAGGLLPGAPSARAFARAWTEEQFIQTLRTGSDPSGDPIQSPMPWEMVGRMENRDLAAIYAYLRSEE